VLHAHGLAWKRIVALVREAYEKVAPADLRVRIGRTASVKAPAKALCASQIDPLQSPQALRVLKSFRKICLALPETHEARQFGYPVWQAGKKTFALARHDGTGLMLGFWVGVDQQGLLTADIRYRIPPYLGHNGWIALKVGSDCDWPEIEALSLQSYRHFALKRMLQQLPANEAGP
jgi:predicted DNA-binding protein (MmcQ/YjbR family)